MKYHKTENRQQFYRAMFDTCKGRCMICGREERLVIDHNHGSGNEVAT
jgi:hypothetical protein